MSRIEVGEQYPVGWWAITDVRGTFAFDRLPERRVYLEVSSDGRITRRVRLPAGADHLDMELGGGKVIRGSLLLADGTPEEGSVSLRLDAPWRALERQVDASGEFRFEGLAAGSYHLHAWSTAGVVENRPITLAKDELASVELLAEPLGHLSGWISGLVESESVSIFISSDDEWRSVFRQDQTSFGNGRLVVRGVLDGDHVAKATARMR